MVYVRRSVELERPTAAVHGGAAAWVVADEAFPDMAQ
jgi:hypothetical protein